MENFGKIAKDKVTGFTGMITAVTYYMYGCCQYCLQPKVDNDGKVQDVYWVDEGRIDIIDNGNEINPESVKSNENGCETRSHGNK